MPRISFPTYIRLVDCCRGRAHERTKQSKAGVVILTKFGNFHSGIETKIWTASERFLEKF